MLLILGVKSKSNKIHEDEKRNYPARTPVYRPVQCTGTRRNPPLAITPSTLPAFGIIVDTTFSFFEDDAHYVRGGSIDLEFGRSIFLGWSWHRMRDDLFLEEGNVSFKLRHRGLKLAYAPAAGKVVHPYFSVMAGSGKIDITGDSDDRIFGITPTGGLEINVTEWFRLGAEAGYRYLTDVDVRNLGSEDFSTLLCSDPAPLRI